MLGKERTDLKQASSIAFIVCRWIMETPFLRVNRKSEAYQLHFSITQHQTRHLGKKAKTRNAPTSIAHITIQYNNSDKLSKTSRSAYRCAYQERREDCSRSLTAKARAHLLALDFSANEKYKEIGGGDMSRLCETKSHLHLPCIPATDTACLLARVPPSPPYIIRAACLFVSKDATKVQSTV